MANPSIAPAPVTTAPLVTDPRKGTIGNQFVVAWVQWFTTIWNSVSGPANTVPPATSNAVGITGQLAFDQNYLYIYTGVQWKRIPLTSF